MCAIRKIAMAGNRTRINCLEGNYADHYTTIAYLEKVIVKFISREKTTMLSSGFKICER